jgi:hypothetical protein
MNLTPERVAGIRFEIWLEQYFKSLGCQQVKRNVEFHKSQHLYRQADLIFSEVVCRNIATTNIEMVIIEAKYSSNGQIKYELRQGYKEKSGSRNIITNLVDEITERQKFVGAYRSILVTNARFDEKLLREAPRHNIQLIDRETLYKNYRRLGGKHENLEKSINSIDISRYDLRKNIYQIR